MSPGCISLNDISFAVPLYEEYALVEAGTDIPICLKHQYTKPEQSNDVGPVFPQTYGLHNFDKATSITSEFPFPNSTSNPQE